MIIWSKLYVASTKGAFFVHLTDRMVLPCSQHRERPMGARVLTVFLYLSDVEEGGGTHFPDLGSIAVQPKKGRVVMWPSVRNGDPHAEDERTVHGSFPVEAGVKYGANAFIHQRDTKEAYAKGCF